MPDLVAWRLEDHPNGLATLWFDRPGSSQNTLDRATLDQLDETLAKIEKRVDLLGLLIRSAKPKGFCAGADLKTIRACENFDPLHNFLLRGSHVLSRLSKLPIPTVAVVHGTCLGGGLELALSCGGIATIDLPETRLGTPEIKLGLIPGWGAIPALCRRIGFVSAIRMLMTGEPIEAKSAINLGLADFMTTPETCLTECLRFSESNPISQFKRWPPDDYSGNQSSLTSTQISPYAESPAARAILEIVQAAVADGPDSVAPLTLETLARLGVSSEVRAAIDALFGKKS